MGESPRVSIIMGVFNAEETLAEAIDSILAQSFDDWEIVLCDDGSRDDSLEICHRYARAHPDRFVVLKNAENIKLAATLNRCLVVARGSLIARMDADDISVPQRLERQVALLDSNPGVDLVGTSMRRFDENGPGDIVLAPRDPDRTTLRRAKPFNHATIVARREVYEELGGYDESRRAERCEDYDLWFRFFAHGFTGVNIVEPLYLVREDSSAFRRRTPVGRLNEFRTAVAGFRLLGYPVHWYIRPAVQLLKALVPTSLQRWFRRLQGARLSGAA